MCHHGVGRASSCVTDIVRCWIVIADAKMKKKKRKKTEKLFNLGAVNEINGCRSVYTRMSSISVENHSGYYQCVHKQRGALRYNRQAASVIQMAD